MLALDWRYWRHPSRTRSGITRRRTRATRIDTTARKRRRKRLADLEREIKLSLRRWRWG